MRAKKVTLDEFGQIGGAGAIRDRFRAETPASDDSCGVATFPQRRSGALSAGNGKSLINKNFLRNNPIHRKGAMHKAYGKSPNSLQ
jgi:hypothetical protein